MCADSAMEHDVMVIGGGPAGSAAAIYLANKGRRVLLLEKDRFPRFHVGESLLPYSRIFFEELGVMPALREAGFVRKWGAQFHLGSGEKSTYFAFSDGRFTREREALQVDRATFDTILLERARECGVEVREGWRVRRFSEDGSHVTLSIVDPDGKEHRESAKFVVDASGRSNVTGNQEGLREIHADLQKVALFGHFEGVAIDSGSRSGDTVIVRTADAWFWIIPLSAKRASVGCVLDREAIRQCELTPEERFYREVEKTPEMRSRMAGAQLIGPLRSTGDFSYHNRRSYGPRVVRVGDALGFMDPIFSAGVHLALYSARMASGVIDEALTRGSTGQRGFRRYERRMFSRMATYWDMVTHFYTRPFMEMLLEPRDRWGLVGAVNAILAGELDLPWRVRWRLRLFFWLVRLQKRWPIVPRIKEESL